MKKKIIEKAITNILYAIGENPERDGLKDTPARVAKAWEEMMSGYETTSEEILNKVFKDITVKDHLIQVVDIPVYSFCEHHLLPFFGTAKVEYKPSLENGVVGLSKINRLVKNISRKLQTQERITFEIARDIKHYLKAKYVKVTLECRHMCIEMRGVNHSGSKTITTEVMGEL